MGFFDLFKNNKRIGEADNWKKSLNDSLKISFKNVKDDISKIIDKIKSIEGSKEIKFEEIERRLKLLESFLISSKQIEQEDYGGGEEEITLPKTLVDITDTQKTI